MAADRTAWAAPDRTLAMATSQIGHGAWTRSSISRVNPNSWDIGQGDGLDPLEHDRDPDDARARGWWRTQTPAVVPPPPIPWPILGKT